MRVVIAGGGTGGHLYPGIALADKFCEIKPDAEIVFVGTRRGIESRVLPESRYALLLLPVRGLRRKLTLQNLLFPFRLGISILKCVRFFRQFQPKLVIGTGGYVSGPALMAAKLLRIPRVIQEQNSFPGLANRRIGSKVEAVFLTFEASRKYFAGQENIFVFGNPIRSTLGASTRADGCRFFGLDEGQKTLLIFGGSQGAKKLNEVVDAALPDLLKITNIQLIWAVGQAWYDEWKGSRYESASHLKVMSYIKEMEMAYAAADLVVCRAGATTISELVTCGLPTIYVPYPHATGDHQTANAKAIVEKGGGELIQEKELTAPILVERIQSLLFGKERLQKMAIAAKKLSMDDAAEKIARQCLKIMKEEGPCE
ncbi:MAG: undecaprenyldiphospho-muramoylpentapeptide beta-N-acetylglucosaminyltransferase [bacterium]